MDTPDCSSATLLDCKGHDVMPTVMVAELTTVLVSALKSTLKNTVLSVSSARFWPCSGSAARSFCGNAGNDGLPDAVACFDSWFELR
jgi:hypothetical protein